MAALWLPEARRLRVAGIGRAPSERAPQEMMDRLRAQRAPVFKRLPASAAAVDGWFVAHGRQWPTMERVGRVGRRSRRQRVRRRTGLDGLRRAAWRRAGPESLGWLIWTVMGGASPPEPLVATLLVFLSKNVLPMEVGEVWHDASALRPLGLQSTDTDDKLAQRSLNASRLPPKQGTRP